MGEDDVMEEIRAEAKRRGQEREAQEQRLRQQQQALLDLDRKPDPRPERKALGGAPGGAPSGASAGRSPAPEERELSRPFEAGGDGPGVGVADSHVIESSGVEMPLCGCGGSEPIGEQIFALAGLHPPSDGSFGVFFKEWFEQDYFPTMSSKMQRELVGRARTKGFFSGLSSQVKKWALANTDSRLQAEVWSAYFAQHSPPQFQTYGVVRSATVNLGSWALPCMTTFWGYRTQQQGDQWRVSPFASADPDISAILDELDGRGGMTALLSAA